MIAFNLIRDKLIAEGCAPKAAKAKATGAAASADANDDDDDDEDDDDDDDADDIAPIGGEIEGLVGNGAVDPLTPAEWPRVGKVSFFTFIVQHLFRFPCVPLFGEAFPRHIEVLFESLFGHRTDARMNVINPFPIQNTAYLVHRVLIRGSSGGFALLGVPRHIFASLPLLAHSNPEQDETQSNCNSGDCSHGC